MKGEQFVKLPRELLESAAFQSLSPNAFRVVHFLMIEHLRHGGRRNGNLKAPHRQLVKFGIAPQYVTEAICEAEERGLRMPSPRPADRDDLCFDLAVSG